LVPNAEFIDRALRDGPAAAPRAEQGRVRSQRRILDSDAERQSCRAADF
jgi:hypothetical protein